ncbi:hypothetical protein DMENIID0001_030350 [Sergentomyia squamirostris]
MTTTLETLNKDCLLMIFSYLSLKDLIMVEKVCEKFSDIVVYAVLPYEVKYQGILDLSCLAYLDINRKQVRRIYSKAKPMIHSLRFSGAHREPFPQFFIPIFRCKRSFTNLQHLYIENFDMSQENTCIYLARFSGNFKLKTLKLENCFLEDRLIAVILMYVTKLESLSLAFNPKIDGWCLRFCWDLKELNLTGCKLLKNVEFEQFCARNSTLKRLFIKGTKISLNLVQESLLELEELEVEYGRKLMELIGCFRIF